MKADDELPAGVLRAQVGDLLCTRRGRETRRKADDFELWARMDP